MPSYDYSCPSCGRVIEFIHRISEKPKYKCPDCDTEMVRIYTLNRTGFILKGGTPAINDKEITSINRIAKSDDLLDYYDKILKDGDTALNGIST
jgi:putative FmdB family regulatory protein